MLAGYDYIIDYREDKSNKNTDALNRLSFSETVNVVRNSSEVIFVSNIDNCPVTLK